MCRPRMTKYRVKMDMSQFYDDERNLAYILVDPKWEQVRRLQEHVEKLFDVTNVHFLTNDGVFIPPKESIDIIQSNDILRAIIPQKIKRTRIKTGQNGGYGDEMVTEEGRGSSANRENDGRMTCSTPNQRPTKKQKVSVEVMQLKIQENADGYKGYRHADRGESKGQQYNGNDTLVSSSNSSSTGAMTEQTPDGGKATDETVKSRKRKRSRKKKSPAGTRESSRLSSVPIPISSSTVRLSKSLNTTKQNQSPKHVHFDDSATLVEEDAESRENRVVFRCRLNTDGTIQSREIKADENEEYEEDPPKKKPKIQIHENVVIVRGNESAADETADYSVIEVEDSQLNGSTAVNGNESEGGHANEYSKVSVDDILPLTVPMPGLPSTGDVVLFKMYKLTDMCGPGISEYICGRCEEVDPVKRTMSCRVLDGYDQIDESAVQSKGDGATNGRGSCCVVFFLDDLLDKRVFSMS